MQLDNAVVDLGADFTANSNLTFSFLNGSQITGASTLTNQGTIDIGAGETLTIQQATVIMDTGSDAQVGAGGFVSVENNASLNFNVDTTLDSGTTISLDNGGAIGGTATLTNQGKLNSANSTLTINGFVDNEATGILDVLGDTTLDGTGTLRNAADLTLDGETIDLTFVQTGGAGTAVLANFFSVGGALVFESGANIDTDQNDFFVSGAGTIDNSAVLDLIDDQFAVANITNRSGGEISLSGGTLSQIDTDGLVDNQSGAIIIADSSQSEIDLTGGGVLQNAGDIKITGFGDSLRVTNGELQNTGGIDIANGASLDIVGGTLSMLSGGALTGTGSVTLASEFNVGAGVDFTLTNAGPGLELTNGDISGTGTMTSDNNVTMSTSGTLDIDSYTNLRNLNFDGGNFNIGAGINFANNAGGTVTVDATNGATTATFGSSWTNAGVFNITSDTNGNAPSVIVSPGQTLTNTGELLFDGTSTSNMLYRGDLSSSGLINFDSGLAGFDAGIYSSSGSLDIAAASTVQLDFTSSGSFASTGIITLGAGSNLRLFGGSFTNDGSTNFGTGQLDILSNGVFTQNVNLGIGSGALINVGAGGTLNGSALFTNNIGATLALNDGGVLALDTNNTGTITSNNNVFTVDGTLTLNSGGNFDLAAGGSLLGTGFFDNRQDITLDGQTIDATYQQTTGTATLSGADVTVNGTLSVGGSGDLLSDSNTSLDGTGVLDVQGTGTFVGSDVTIATLAVSGDLTLRDDMSVNSTDIDIAAGGTVSGFTGGDFGPIIDVGAGAFNNDGTMNVGSFGRLNLGDITAGGTYVNSSTGVINVSDDGDINVNEDQFSNFGNINLDGASPSTVKINTKTGGIFRNEIGGVVTGVAGTDVIIALDAGDNNSFNLGTMVFNDGVTFRFDGSGSIFRNGGTINITDAATGFTLDGPGAQGGEFINNTGGTISVSDSAGTINQIDGAVFTNNGGNLSFGSSPGSLTFSGDIANSNDGRIEFELGGLPAGIHEGYDQMTVLGTLTAGGILDVVEFEEFEVGVGDSFTIVQAGQIEGSFDAIEGLDVGGGVVLDAVQSASAVTLTGKAVTHQGDGGDNTLTGGAGDDVMSAGDGNDFIVGGGGADLMHGGSGDDVFAVSDTGFGRLDGGGGTDLVSFDGAGQTFDLTQLRGDQLGGIERIDFAGFGDNVLTIDDRIAFAATGGANSLTGAEHSLLIDGDAGDSLNAAGNWNNTGTVTIGGEGYTVYQSANNDAQIFVDDDITVSAA